MSLDLIDKLAPAVVAALANGLRDLKPDNPTQALVIGAVRDYVVRYGLEGFELLRDKLMSAASGEDVDLDLSDLAAASDLLAILQRREAVDRRAVLDALAKAGQVVGTLAGALISAALEGVVSGAVV